MIKEQSKLVCKSFLWYYHNDPVRKCSLYRNEGCAHVDGLLCDYPECSMLKEYNDKLKESAMIQVTKPDYELNIGIKDGRVISMEWGTEFFKYEDGVLLSKYRKKKLIEYYKQAIRFIKDMKD